MLARRALTVCLTCLLIGCSGGDDGNDSGIAVRTDGGADSGGTIAIDGGPQRDGGGPLPGETYARCAESMRCDNYADYCIHVRWLVGEGDVCTTYCLNAGGCPAGFLSMCLPLVGDLARRRICYEVCSTDADCAETFLCRRAMLEGEDSVELLCLPE